MTKPISTKAHGVLDYATAAGLLAAPELFGLKEVRAAALLPRLAGASAAAYSAVTDYELGLRRLLSMRTHLVLDGMSGALLAASPWLFGFARNGRRFWLPHVLVGTMEVAVALTTKTDAE